MLARTNDVTKAGGIGDDVQLRTNSRLWARGDLARKREYASSDLRPVERALLARYREDLSERVLELGCGAGRLTGHLARVARAVHAIDLSPAMIEACRERYPGVTVEEKDLRGLSSFSPGSFDAVIAPYNVLDVLGEWDRRQALHDIRRILPAYGFLVMSSHNLAAPPPKTIPRPATLREVAGTAVRLPRWVRNRRRLLPFERVERDYAILNDCSHDYEALHYYTTRDAQERQLAEHGLALVDCLDLDGRSVEAGTDAAHASELHYVARRTG